MSEPSPVLDQLNLVVKDMDATLTFYRLVGLDIPDETVFRTESGAHHVEVKLANGFELAFDSRKLAGIYNAGWREPSGQAGQSVLTFRMPSRDAVNETHARLCADGHTNLQEPYDAFWGARYAIVADPDGNHVGLMSVSDPERRGRPPEM